MEIAFSARFQLLGLLVILLLIIDFFRRAKLPVMSTRVFGAYLVVTLIYNAFDFASYYTVSHPDIVPESVNRIVHQIFIGSLLTMIFLLFLYVYYLSEAQKRMKAWQNALCVLPYATSLAMVLIAPLYYYNDGVYAYSYGSMVYLIYIGVAVYLTATFIILFKKGNAYTSGGQLSAILPDFRRARKAVTIGLFIWIVIAVIQFIFPQMLISCIGATLMALYVYLVFENPAGYYDSESDSLNTRAFHIMVPEMLARKKSFYVVSFSLDNIHRIIKSKGHDGPAKILRDASSQLSQMFPTINIYRSESYTLTMFIKEEVIFKYITNTLKKWSFTSSDGMSVHYHISVIKCPKFADSVDKLYDAMSYCRKEFSRRESGGIYTLDEDMEKELNYRAKVLEILTKAVEEKAFNVVYQPIYSAEKKRFASAEALVRLRDDKTVGFISPEVFIPMAEERGLIEEIGSIVFEKVCEFASREKLSEIGIDYIEVNLSGVQSVDPTIADRLHAVMEKYDIPPKFLNLEITETASVDGGDMLLKNMDRLRSMGCHFSMDDFGTGYSNLSQMAKVRFELIKLDKSLIWPCFGENNSEPLIILNSCIDMILRLGVKIVAEGVETPEQARMLIDKGVTYLQGYYFSKPVGEIDFINRVKQGAEI